LSRNLLAALFSAALLIAPGATAALAAPPAAADHIDAVQEQAERITPELTKLSGQVGDALARLEGTAAALAEAVPGAGQAGCELDEAARRAAFERVRTRAGGLQSSFDDASTGAIGALQDAADRFVAQVTSAASAPAVAEAFESFEAALARAAGAGGAAMDAAGAGVEGASRDAAGELDAACASQDEIDQVSAEAESARDTVTEAGGLLQAALPIVLAQLNEAERAILATMSGDGEPEGQDTATTTTATTTTVGDGGDDESGRSLPFTGAGTAMVPLLVFGLVVVGVGAVLVVAGRRKGSDPDS
jgi:hypothetical protein